MTLDILLFAFLQTRLYNTQVFCLVIHYTLKVLNEIVGSLIVL